MSVCDFEYVFVGFVDSVQCIWGIEGDGLFCWDVGYGYEVVVKDYFWDGNFEFFGKGIDGCGFGDGQFVG